MTVVFTAPCPVCRGDAEWHQSSGSGYSVVPGDFRVLCRTCDPPPAP